MTKLEYFDRQFMRENVIATAVSTVCWSIIIIVGTLIAISV